MPLKQERSSRRVAAPAAMHVTHALEGVRKRPRGSGFCLDFLLCCSYRQVEGIKSRHGRRHAVHARFPREKQKHLARSFIKLGLCQGTQQCQKQSQTSMGKGADRKLQGRYVLLASAARKLGSRLHLLPWPLLLSTLSAFASLSLLTAVMEHDPETHQCTFIFKSSALIPAFNRTQTSSHQEKWGRQTGVLENVELRVSCSACSTVGPVQLRPGYSSYMNGCRQASLLWVLWQWINIGFPFGLCNLKQGA